MNASGPGWSAAQHGDLVHLRLDGTGANALGHERYAALTRAAAAVDEHQVLLVTGDGDHFSAGQDLREFATAREEGRLGALLRQGTDAVLALLECRGTVVAAARGAAVGGGALVLAAADVVLLGEDARIRVPELELGLPLGASVLARLVGGPASRRLMLTGAWADAREVAAYGGVRVVPADSLLEEAHQVAEALLRSDHRARTRARDLFGERERARAAAGYRAEVEASLALLG